MTVTKAIDAIKTFLKESSIEYDFDEEQGLFTAEVNNDLHVDKYYFKLYDTKNCFVFYIVPSFLIPKQDIPSVVEFITRVNLGLLIGNFEFDYVESKVRFKSAIGLVDNQLSDDQVAVTVRPAVRAWKSYLPGVIEVMARVASPTRALNKIDYGE